MKIGVKNLGIFVLGLLFLSSSALADCQLSADGYQFDLVAGQTKEKPLRELLRNPQTTDTISWALDGGQPNFVTLNNAAEKLVFAPTATHAGQNFKFRLGVSCGQQGQFAAININVVVVPEWKHGQGKILDLGKVYENEQAVWDLNQFVTTADSSNKLEFTESGLAQNAPWLSLKQGTLSGIPRQGNLGRFSNIVLTAKHPSGGSALTFAEGEVLPAVIPPKWTQKPIAAGEATEDQPFSFKTSHLVEHKERDFLSFELNNAPTWLKVNPFNGDLSGTPGRADVGPLKNVSLRVFFFRGPKVWSDTAELQLNVKKVNKAPVWNTKVIQMPPGATGEFYNQTLAGSASDPDGDPITFVLGPGPGVGSNWATLHPKGKFSGTPQLDNAGANTWKVTVSDGQLSDEAEVKITVVRTNQPPSVPANLVLPPAREDQDYSANLANYVKDPDPGDVLVFSEPKGIRRWYNISPSGVVSGKPRKKDVGNQTIEFSVTDGKPNHTVPGTALVQVDHINHKPTFTPRVVKLNYRENDAISLQLSDYGKDEDGDKLTFTKLEGPDWFVVNENTGEVSGKAVAGFSSALIRVKDPSGAYEDGFIEITVKPVNKKPYWDDKQFSLEPATAGKPYSKDLRTYAHDPDFDQLTFTLNQSAPLPNWLTLTPKGILSGEPPKDQVGKVIVMTIAATDPSNESATAIIDFKILESAATNIPPFFINRDIPLGDVKPGTDYTFDLRPWAKDVEGDKLSFTLLPNSAPWLRMDPDGKISGKVPGSYGPFKAYFEVKDIHGGVDTTEGTGTIKDTIVPTPPVWEPNIRFEAVEGKMFTANLKGKATDNAGNNISFATAGSRWLQVAPDGTISGIPTADSLGEKEYRIKATNIAGSTETGILINVKPQGSNKAPYWPVDPVKLQAKVGVKATISLIPHAVDPDNEALRFEKVDANGNPTSAPAWITIDPVGTLEGTPPSLGMEVVYVKASDPSGASQKAQIQIQVTSSGSNSPPKWASTPLVLPAGQLGVKYEVNLNSATYVTDPDGDPLTFSAPVLPPWASLDEKGKLTGTPNASGLFEFSLRVTDKITSVVGVKTSINVTGGGTVGGPPKWQLPLNFNVTPDVISNLDLNNPKYVVEPDGQAMSFLLLGEIPSWISLTGSVLRLSPKLADAGKSYPLQVRATDSEQKSADATMVFTVTGGSTTQRPPVWLLDPIKITVPNGPVNLNLAKSAKDLNSPPLALSFRKSDNVEWLRLSGEGTLSGTPPTTGEFGFVAYAQNSAGIAEAQVVITVRPNMAERNDRLSRPILKAPLETLWVMDYSWSQTFGDKLIKAFLKALPQYSQALDNSEVDHRGVFLSADAQAWKGNPVPDAKNRYVLLPSGRWLTDFNSHLNKLKTGQVYSSPLWSLMTFHAKLGELTTVYGNHFAENAVPLEVFILSPQVDQFRRYAGQGSNWTSEKFVERFEQEQRGLNKPFRISTLAAHCPRLGDPFTEKTPAIAETDFYRATRATGGRYIKWDCSVDLEESLRAYGKEMVFRANAMAKKEILLPHPPASAQSITVMIGKYWIPGNTGKPTDQWSYDATTNALRLHWDRIDLVGVGSEDYLKIYF